MKQHLLKLTLPESGMLHPAAFRERLAVAADLTPEFFNRDDKGDTINCRPVVRTLGGRNWVGILVDGDQNRPLLDMAILPSVTIARSAAGSSISIDIERKSFHIEHTEKLYSYFVREMVIKRRTPKAKSMETTDIVEARIRSGLEAAALNAGLDFPVSEDDVLVRVTDLHRPRGLRLQTTTGITNEYVELVDVEFATNFWLKGYWFVGNLTSRGYGRIGKLRDQYFVENGRRGVERRFLQ